MVCRLFSCSYFFCQGGRHSTLLLAKKAWLELEESLNKLYEWRLGWTHAVGQVKLGGGLILQVLRSAKPDQSVGSTQH